MTDIIMSFNKTDCVIQVKRDCWVFNYDWSGRTDYDFIIDYLNGKGFPIEFWRIWKLLRQSILKKHGLLTYHDNKNNI